MIFVLAAVGSNIKSAAVKENKGFPLGKDMYFYEKTT